MSNLRIVGRDPDSDASVTHKKYVDTRYTSVKVDQAVVDAAVAYEAQNLVVQSYVDQADAVLAHKTSVNTADSAYVLATQRAAANGVASIGSDGFVPTAQIPAGLQTDRVIKLFDQPTVALTTRVVTTNNLKEYAAATLIITDPGYAYRALVFASVSGYHPVDSAPATGSYGKLAVLNQNDVVLAGGITTGNNGVCPHYAIPFAAQNVTPGSVSALVGTQTLTLYLSLWSGVSYTFTNQELKFSALVYSAI